MPTALTDWPRAYEKSLTELCNLSIEKSSSSALSEGWFRLPLLFDLAHQHTGLDRIFADHVTLLHMSDAPLMACQAILQWTGDFPYVPWPTNADLDDCKKDGWQPSNQTPFGQLWHNVQEHLRRNPQAPIFESKWPSVATIPVPQLKSRSAFDRSLSIGSQISGLSRLLVESQSRQEKVSSKVRRALDFSLANAPAFWAVCILAADALEARKGPANA